jgi:hypothetical protein
MIDQTAPKQPDSKNRLKNVLEQSLAVMCDAGSAAGDKVKIGSPQRSSLPLHMDAAYLQKGAMADAAKALATLWKISKPTGRSGERRPPDKLFLQLKLTSGA